MPNPVEAAVRRTLRAARRVAWLEVVYWSGTHAIPLRAIKSEADVELAHGDGSVTSTRVTDWRILAEDLVKNGQRFRPSSGERIEVMAGSTCEVYEVMPVTGDECYQPTDPYGTAFKVHTKLVDERE